MGADSIGLELERHRAEMTRLVANLKTRILAGPENQRVTKLAPRCGVVRFSDFAAREFDVEKNGIRKMRPGNWSVEHHDFRAQYEAVVAAIDRAYPDRAVEVVVEAAETGKLRMGTGTTLTLHSDVVEYLKGVLA
jgi:hypothetical protein